MNVWVDFCGGGTIYIGNIYILQKNWHLTQTWGPKKPSSCAWIAGRYYSQLKQIRTSEGDWDATFHSNLTQYQAENNGREAFQSFLKFLVFMRNVVLSCFILHSFSRFHWLDGARLFWRTTCQSSQWKLTLIIANIWVVASVFDAMVMVERTCWPWLVMDFWFVLVYWLPGLVAANVACKAVTFIHKSMCKQLSV